MNEEQEKAEQYARDQEFMYGMTETKEVKFFCHNCREWKPGPMHTMMCGRDEWDCCEECFNGTK